MSINLISYCKGARRKDAHAGFPSPRYTSPPTKSAHPKPPFSPPLNLLELAAHHLGFGERQVPEDIALQTALKQASLYLKQQSEGFQLVLVLDEVEALLRMTNFVN